jgi:hypothetical protein
MVNRMEKRKQEETAKMLRETRLGLNFWKLCKWSLHSFLVTIHLLLIPYNQLPPLHESKLKDWEFRRAFIFWSCMEANLTALM